ncbi:MAG: hypothetical protein Q8M16_19195 [Pirellulaceae bacterium]|nr:hypothetical protein [Pirellulaceae bacterium]
MNRFLLTMLAGLLLLLPGCGVTVEPNAAAVDVKFNVSRGGKAVNDLKLNLQALAKGAGAVGDIKNGVATIHVFPGTYTYYVTAGSTEATLTGIPESMQSGSMDRKIEIVDGSPIDVKLD